MSGDKSGAASPPGGMQAQNAAATLLLSLLTEAYDSSDLASRALIRALARARLGTAPETASDLVVFTRGHLLETLRLDLGPTAALAFVDGFLARLPDVNTAPPSEPPESMQRRVARITLRPSSRPVAARLSVLIVDPDRVRRAPIGRALLRADFDVTAVDTVEEVTDELHEAIDVAIVDLQSPWTPSAIRAVAASRPSLYVIGCGRTQDPAAILFAREGLRFEVRPRDATPEELVDATRRLVEPLTKG